VLFSHHWTKVISQETMSGDINNTLFALIQTYIYLGLL